MLLCDDLSLVLLVLDLQTCRYEKLDTVFTFTQHGAFCTYEFLVPLKRRIADTPQCYDNAFAILIEFCFSGSRRSRQLYVVFTVRDDHLVAAGEPRVLEHRMNMPTSVGDGQTLLGFVKNEDDLRYECLLDVESGKLRPLQVDSSGRPVESDLYRLIWVNGQRENADGEGCRFVFRRNPQLG